VSPPGRTTSACGLYLAVALGAAAFLAGAETRAAGGTVQVSIEIPAGKTRTVRLRNLPRGTHVTIRIDASGKLVIALVSGVQLKSRTPEAVFRGALDRRMSFKVVVPESSDYYLVLDNRRATEAVKARATIRVVRESTGPSTPPPAKPAGKLKETRVPGPTARTRLLRAARRPRRAPELRSAVGRRNRSSRSRSCAI